MAESESQPPLAPPAKADPCQQMEPVISSDQTMFKDLDGIGAKEMQDGILPEKANQVLNELVRLNSAEVVRGLINRWVLWIAIGQREPLVDALAERLRTNPQAVLPLVEKFAMDLELTNPLKRAILEQIFSPPYQPTIKSYFLELFDTNGKTGEENSPLILVNLVKQLSDSIHTTMLDLDLRQKVRQVGGEHFTEQNEKLLTALTNRFEKMKSRNEVNAEDNAQMYTAFESLFLVERARREREVYQRIASQLAHMSDERFYLPDQDQYKKVKAELVKHAVPVVVFRLPERRDLETRWRLALMLGYIGGREAIDPLVQVLIGEESARATRQQQLREYYLDPSQKRSEEAANIQNDAVIDARRTLRILQILNIAVFIMGVIIIGAGLTLSFSSVERTQIVVGALVTLGGLTGILVQFIRNPLDRIQNALANLVLIETAFTNFIWEQNLNNTYIQSRYVAGGILTDEDISKTMGLMENAMVLTMSKIQTFSKDFRNEKVYKDGNNSKTQT